LALALLLLLVETSPFSQPLGEIFPKHGTAIKLPRKSPKKSELTAKNDGNEQENPKTGSGWAVFFVQKLFQNFKFAHARSQIRKMDQK